MPQTPEEIREMRTLIDNTSQWLWEKRQKLQAECPHANIKKTWDYLGEEYRDCEDCGKSYCF
jgi:hypothetical protein